MRLERVFNFAAGPSCLPEPVLKRAQEEILNYKGKGLSVMEMSHRSKVFGEIIQSAEQNIRDLMHIPDQYKVLFLQGGASTQFAMVPLNLFRGSKKADAVQTGAWSKKMIAEAGRYGSVNIIASSADQNFSYIPQLDKSAFHPDADFFHITQNNTIEGTRYTQIPDTGDVPLVADMSSMILSEVCDVNRYGLIYAGAQKNIGPAGVTLVIIREDLIGQAMEITPSMLNYKLHADERSLYNTPPAYGIYMCNLVFEWVKEQGGVAALQRRNEAKAKLLYDYLDHSKMFKGTVRKEDRSLMNVPFVTGDADLDASFIKEATARGLIELKGHRSVGGMRASLYNAMPIEGVQALVSFMADFETNQP